MKRFFGYSLMVFTLCLGFVSCSDDDDDAEPAVEQLAVNYANISGTWRLVSYNGNTLDADTYLYIVFDRRDHTFEMYDNLQSMYGEKRTGSYQLDTDDDTETTVLSGFYDHGVGAWDNEYTVAVLTEKEMHLTTLNSDGETCVYQRVDALPHPLN